MNPRRPHRRTNLGFTIVELVATLVIIAVVCAVTLPRLIDSDSFSERGYTDELASALRYAQRIAVASRCNVRLVVAAGDYSGFQRTDCDGTGAWTSVVLRADGPLSGIADAGVITAPAGTVIEFSRDGGVVGGAPPQLTVAGFFRIDIDAITGQVTVTP